MFYQSQQQIELVARTLGTIVGRLDAIEEKDWDRINWKLWVFVYK